MKKLFQLMLLTYLITKCTYSCDTPVFQYALIRWYPDPYRIFVFYEKDFSEQQKQTIKLLNELERKSLIICEYVKISELPSKNKSIRSVWESIKNPKSSLPLLVVKYPSSSQLNNNIYISKLSTSAVHQIASSPIRRKIANTLLEGNTIVWLILLSDDTNQNEKLRNLLSTELSKYKSQYFQKNMSNINFAITEVERDNQKEKFLINILTNIKTSQQWNQKEPIIYPIFGKGRILFPIPARKLHHESIFATCDFLTGPCACELKVMNPGVDLLIDIDWDSALSSSDELIEQILPSAEQIDTISTPTKTSFDNNNENSKYTTIYIALTAIIVCFVIASFAIYRYKK